MIPTLWLRRLWPIGLALVLLALAGGVYRRWLLRHDDRIRVEAAVAPAKHEAALAAARVETVTVQLAAAERVVTRLLTQTQVRTDTLVLRPQTARDTAKALAALPVLALAHDSLQRACSAFVVSCADYRTAAERRFATDAEVIRTQDALLRERPPKRYWHLGLTGGYGALLSGGRVLTGPSVTAGVTWMPF